MGDQAFLSSFHRDIGIPINFQEEEASSRFEALNSWASRVVKGCEAPCSDEAVT